MRTGQAEWVIGTNLDVTERKRAEQALKESEKRLRLALSGAKAAAWQWNILTNEVIWSPEAYEIYGRDPEKRLARYENWRDCLHPDDLEPTERLIRDLIRQGAPEYRTEYRVVLPSGELRWIAALGKLDYAADGTALRMSGIDLDITRQKRADQQLMESEMRFRAAQEASLDALRDFRAGQGRRRAGRRSQGGLCQSDGGAICLSTPERMEGRLLSETIAGRQSFPAA